MKLWKTTLLACALHVIGGHAAAATLTITIGGAASGNVGVIPLGQLCSGAGTCTFTIPSGTALRLMANSPTTPGVFSGGTGDAAGCATSTCTFVLNSNSSLSATFNPAAPFLTMSIDLQGDAGGEVGADNNRCQNFDPGQQFSGCATHYAPGSVVTLLPRPPTGTRFSGFSGGTNDASGCGGGLTLSTSCPPFQLNSSSSVTATFSALTSIAVSPLNPTLNIGQSLGLSAIGTFSDHVTESLFPGMGTWTTNAPLTTPRFDLAAAVLDGKLYAIGGAANNCGPTCFGPSGTVEAYDPVSNTWTTRASLNVARAGLAAGTIGGYIYAVGGNQPGPPPASAVATLEVYDPVANSWSSGPDMPGGPRQWLATGVVNGVLYAVGGEDAAGVLLTRVEAYDPGTSTWTPKADMHVARRFLGVGVVNGILYAVGGENGGSLSTVEAYDPGSNTWTFKAPLPSGRGLLAVAVIDGVLYALGGNNGAYLRSVFAYDPAADQWTMQSSMPTARAELAAGVIDGRLYAIGGLFATGFPNQVTPRVESFIDLVWKSNDPGIATIDQYGSVTGQHTGTTVATARVGGITCNGQCATVNVGDAVPPVITSATPSSAILWPPNHKMVGVTISVHVTDNIDPAPGCQITNVSSNEPINGLGDGDAAPDWAISGPLTLNLRSERGGTGSGRVYTIEISCSDQSGNTARTSTQVQVPLDMGK